MQGAYRLQENDMLQIMGKSTLCRNFIKKIEGVSKETAFHC